jgi:RND family efflux transporter MFP subunit
MRIRILAVSRILALSVLAAGCGQPHRDARPLAEGAPKKVSTTVIQRSTEASFDGFVGTVVARNRAEIEPMIQARIERLPIVLGSHVHKGDLLAELDTRDVRAQLQQAQAMYDQTSLDLKRYETLLSQEVVAQQEYDGVKAKATVAEAEVARAEAMLSYAQITAPFSGTVTERHVDVGDVAIPGRSLLTLDEDGDLRFVVAIPESHRARLAVGDTFLVATSDGNATFPATLDEFSLGSDPVTRAYTAKLTLHADARLHSGQFGRLLLPTNADAGLFVPSTAVVHRGQLELVYTSAGDQRATLRLVRTGRMIGDKTEILSGLHEGERIVVQGAADLSDGDRVEELP